MTDIVLTATIGELSRIRLHRNKMLLNAAENDKMSNVSHSAVSAESPFTTMSGFPLQLHEIEAKRGYIPSLDGLRALSVLTVVFAHHINKNWFPGGLGVYVFFVISGYLITRLLFLEKKSDGYINIPAFYFKRVVRLYPAILFYTIFVIISYYFLNIDIDWIQPLSSIFYFANYLYAYREIHHLSSSVMPFGIFWSLSVEEHFYLIFPFVFIFSRAKPLVLVGFSLFVCVASLIWRVYFASFNPEFLGTEVIYMRTDFRADAIAYGVMLAAICESSWNKIAIKFIGNIITWSFALAFIILSLLFRDSFFRETLRYSIQGVAIMVLICGILYQSRLRYIQIFLNASPLVFIGRLSYSIYVWHYASRIFYKYIPSNFMELHKIFDIACTIILAVISFYFIESPFLKLRKVWLERFSIGWIH